MWARIRTVGIKGVKADFEGAPSFVDGNLASWSFLICGMYVKVDRGNMTFLHASNNGISNKGRMVDCGIAITTSIYLRKGWKGEGNIV